MVTYVYFWIWAVLFWCEISWLTCHIKDLSRALIFTNLVCDKFQCHQFLLSPTVSFLCDTGYFTWNIFWRWQQILARAPNSLVSYFLCFPPVVPDKWQNNIFNYAMAVSYNIFYTINTQHISRQDAIITIRLCLATCFGRNRLSSGQQRTILRYSKNSTQWDPISFTLKFDTIWKCLLMIKAVE